MNELVFTRPLSIAEIFDRAVTLAVKQWRPLLAFALLSSVPDVVEKLILRARQPSAGITLGTMLIDTFVGALFGAAMLFAIARGDSPSGVRPPLVVALRTYPRAIASLLLVDVLMGGAAAIVALPIAIVVFAVLSAGGAVAATVAGAVLAVPVAVMLPLIFLVAVLAFANTMLERRSPWSGLVTAVKRCRRGGVVRSWLLGLALLAVTFAPIVVFSAVFDGTAKVTGAWWLGVPADPLSSICAVGFSYALVAVAAVDYRNRTQGTDLLVQLDAQAAS